MTATHVPVLLDELVGVLDPQPGEVAVDCTFGAGGHARAVGERLGPEGTLIAIDRDPIAEENFAALAADVPCHTRFIRASFAEGLEVPARDVVNTWDERGLGRALKELGEERYARQIARAIVRRRRKKALETTQELVDVVTAAIPAPARFGGGHPAKRTFQAVRIVVNDELGQLERALPLAWDILRPNGRFAGISFHSLEDRRVKRFLAERATGCTCPPEFPVCVCGHEPEAELLTRGGIVPSQDEISANPRAKSARLRAARKLAHTEV